jgi:hypothetical protein
VGCGSGLFYCEWVFGWGEFGIGGCTVVGREGGERGGEGVG